MKTVESFFVLILFTSAGIYASNQLEKRIRQLKDLEKAIFLIKREVDYQLSPLGEAMLHTGSRAEFPWSQLFIKTGERLLHKEEKEGKPEVCFKEEISKIRTYHPWEKDLDILFILGRNLGGVDKKLQIAQLTAAEEEVRQAIQYAKEEHQRKGKLYRTLGVCIGLMGVILLI